MSLAKADADRERAGQPSADKIRGRGIPCLLLSCRFDPSRITLDFEDSCYRLRTLALAEEIGSVRAA
ncbi:MAG: hypothetical protein OXL33_06380, partial [Chloroflexota bacterium]|nr:hypothetical protein [Chloroflexota bacterium]